MIEIDLKARLVLVTGSEGHEQIGRDATPEDLRAAGYEPKGNADSLMAKADADRDKAREARYAAETERDSARAEVERLTRDLESARIGAATIASQEVPEVDRLRAERDEAKAEAVVLWRRSIEKEPSSPWAFGPWCALLRNPRPIACPVPVRGYQGTWTVPADVERAVRAQMGGGA